MRDGTAWYTGGMGKLMEENENEVWLCYRDHWCSTSDDYMCWFYNENAQKFRPWNTNNNLGLYGRANESLPGDGRVTLFDDKNAGAGCNALNRDSELVVWDEADHCCQSEDHCCGEKGCTPGSDECGHRFSCDPLEGKCERARDTLTAWYQGYSEYCNSSSCNPEMCAGQKKSVSWAMYAQLEADLNDCRDNYDFRDQADLYLSVEGILEYHLFNLLLSGECAPYEPGEQEVLDSMYPMRNSTPGCLGLVLVRQTMSLMSFPLRARCMYVFYDMYHIHHIHTHDMSDLYV